MALAKEEPAAVQSSELLGSALVNVGQYFDTGQGAYYWSVGKSAPQVQWRRLSRRVRVAERFGETLKSRISSARRSD